MECVSLGKISFAKRQYFWYNFGSRRAFQSTPMAQYRLIAALCEMKDSSTHSTDLRGAASDLVS